MEVKRGEIDLKEELPLGKKKRRRITRE